MADLYSSDFAILPKGINLDIFSTNSSGWLLKTPPGDKALHLIPSLHQYVERYVVRPINPVLITD